MEYSSDPEALAKYLTRVIEDNLIGKYELAKKSGVSYFTITRMLEGKKSLKSNERKVIGAVIEISKEIDSF